MIQAQAAERAAVDFKMGAVKIRVRDDDSGLLVTDGGQGFGFIYVADIITPQERGRYSRAHNIVVVHKSQNSFLSSAAAAGPPS
jgi:hypothetical protein